MSGVNEIRSAFLNYFANNGHEIVPSSPLVPRNDPTLMFTNAGMVQFKNVFTGVEKRPYQRATSSQKCVRAGGKHNDLDNVGYTARHHTFFEMLGNFSFGDYFKDRAIELAWNLITKDYALAKDRLLVTVYSEDEEAAKLWKKIAGLPDSKIIRIGTSDNFWQMGDTGPCGPCSEIFFDHGDKIPGGPPGSADEDGDRFIEIWNLVFMQFDQTAPGQRTPLPKPSIDTGMGLERVAAVLQGKHDNYDIDLFVALIRQIAELTGADPHGPQKASLRVIADHLRASSFLISDGVLPSNEGRGYVLRRIMRRAMRHGQLLGAKEPLMYRLVWALVREMGQAYPELVRAENLIEETLRLEETRFRKTLDRGLILLDDFVLNATAKVDVNAQVNATLGDFTLKAEAKVLPGDTAFTLYDTYGFPLDLTQDALRSRGMSVDVAGFNAAMEKQKAKARAAWAGSGDTKTADYWFPMREKYGATEFLGYDMLSSEAVVVGIIKGGPELTELKPEHRAGEIILNQTPFYAESGGQVWDTGIIKRASDGKDLARVLAVHKEADGLIVHNVELLKGSSLKAGEAVLVEVDRDRRVAVSQNHSATHLLHEALRQVLGDHVSQKGSSVTPERLRFDFSHNKPITADELRRIEDIANDVVLENGEVVTRSMAIDDARESGARALFGEKYGDEVRVVSMGNAKRDGAASNALGWSVELCGGTHVRRTGDIGLISVTGESAVASGVRRIEALTGHNARHAVNATIQTAKSAAAELKTTLDDLPVRIAALVDERKKLEAALTDARKKLAMGGGAAGSGAAAASDVRTIGNVKFLGRTVQGIEIKDLKSLADEGKKQLGSGVVALVATSEDGKASVVVGVTSDLTSRFSAVDLVRVASEALGGKGGGGKPDMAQAGGPDGAKADDALNAIEKAIGG